MTSSATSVAEYLAGLPEDRREAISAVRQAILDHLPEGYEEGMQYGMIGYYVPHSIYPAGYHCDKKQPLPFIGLGSQKNFMAVYAFCIYIDQPVYDWFTDEYKKSGKRMDMGKSCVRFRKLDDLPVDLIGQVVKKFPVDKFVAAYEALIPANRKKS
jgi:uncharacterized protein YdhG (YjbR/CyaY superfamily)